MMMIIVVIVVIVIVNIIVIIVIIIISSSSRSYEGGRSNQKSFLMRGVIVPPYKLIVTNICSPEGGAFLLGGLLSRGWRLLLYTNNNTTNHNTTNHSGANNTIYQSGISIKLGGGDSLRAWESRPLKIENLLIQ